MNLCTRLLPPLVAALSCVVPAAAAGAPQPVTGGGLTWTMANVYDTSAPEGTDRTWLGYVTSVGPPFTNGTASAIAPATGASVTPGSPKGRDARFPFAYPVARGGTYDAETGTGQVELAGTVRFTSSAHGFAITVSNPLVVLRPDGAQVFASGSGSRGSGQTSEAGSAYDRSQPILDLDVRGATRTALGPQRLRVAGMAPAVATPDVVWPGGSYPRGAGPDRTPNTFGAFDLEIDTSAAGAPPAAAPAPGRVQQPTGGVTTARPRVRCAAARTARGTARTRCEVRVDAHVRRVVVRAGTKRLAVAAARVGVARVDLPRRRRTLTFVATDAKGRELSRTTKRVGG